MVTAVVLASFGHISNSWREKYLVTFTNSAARTRLQTGRGGRDRSQINDVL